MKIIIHDNYIEVLEEGYNIIKKTVYDEDILKLAGKLKNELID